MGRRLILFLIMKAKKSLGQNFLIDKNIIKKIVQSIDVNNNDLIIEIGPGKGALTKELKNKDVNILCYEIDKDLIPYLNKLIDNKTKIIYEDVLNANIKNDISKFEYQRLFIVGNLPYYITTAIIKYLISLNLDIYKMIFMVQEEVANRFTAKVSTKDYSSITLYLNFCFNVKKLFTVSKKSFYPIPKVESAIIEFSKRIERINVDKEKYMNLINDSFKMKRKTLKNNLKKYDFSKIKKVLDKFNLPENVRAEQIKEEVFIEISKII